MLLACCLDGGLFDALLVLALVGGPGAVRAAFRRRFCRAPR